MAVITRGKKLGNPLTDVIKLVPDKKKPQLSTHFLILAFDVFCFFHTLETLAVFISASSKKSHEVFMFFCISSFSKKLAKDKKSHLQ